MNHLSGWDALVVCVLTLCVTLVSLANLASGKNKKEE